MYLKKGVEMMKTVNKLLDFPEEHPILHALIMCSMCLGIFIIFI
jgi:hypothetical protein